MKRRKESEIFRKRLFSAMKEGLALHEILPDEAGRPRDYRILEVNDAFESILGIPRDRAVGSLASELYGVSPPPFLDRYARVARGGEADTFEAYFPPMGKHFSVSVFSYEPGKFGTLFVDHTRRKVEAERYAVMSRALDQNPSYFIITDVEGTIRYVNPRFTEVTGYTFEEVRGKNPRILKSGRTPDAVYRNLWSTILSGEIWRGELLNRHRDGGLFWEFAVIGPLKNEKDEITGFVAVKEDISDRKAAEERNEHYRKYLEHLSGSAIRFLAAESEEEIFRLLGEDIETFFPYAAALILSVDREEPEKMRLQAVWGTEDGEKNQGSFEGPYSLPAGIRGIFRSGKMAPCTEGAESFFRNVPCSRQLRRLWENPNVRETSTLGLVYGSTLYGGVLILNRDSSNEDMGEFMNVYARQVSLALRRIRIEEDLLAAKNAAEAGNRAKRDFLANMSHEFRTPLNGIVGMVYLLRNTPLTPEQDEYLSLLSFSAENLSSIVSDLLDFVRIDSGSLKIRSGRFNVRELFESSISGFKSLADKKQLFLRWSVATDCEWFYGDRDRISQVLANLLSNAIKYTDRGGVEVVVRKEGDLVITVSDTGIGIPEKNLGLVFEDFRQAEDPYTRSRGGLGIGLSIVRHLVELMDGTVEVRSTPGTGSVFTVRFREQPQEKRAAPSLPAQGATKNGKPGKVLRALVAEDEPVNRLYVSAILKRHGWAVIEAGDGEDAVREARQSRYDLILMDVGMPKMDGIEAVRAIRLWERQNGTSPVPIVALTAFAEDQEKCLEAGMDEYLAKPVGESSLLATIETLVS